MAEVLPLGDLALMPAAKQQLLVIEERPVLGAEIGGGHLPGGGRRSAGHGAVRRSTSVLAQVVDADSPLWRRDEGVTRRKGDVNAAGDGAGWCLSLPVMYARLRGR